MRNTYEDLFNEELKPLTHEEFLQKIGEYNRWVVQQVTRGMNLVNAEVSITYDSQIDIKEFTIRGLLLPLPADKER